MAKKTKAEKEKAKVMRKMLRKTLVLGLAPIIISAMLVISICSVIEAHGDYVQAEAAAADAEQQTPEEEYDTFVFQAATGPVQRTIAWISFYVFKLCRTGWPVKVAYHFAVLAIWICFSVILLIVWIGKTIAAASYVSQGRQRYGLSHWELQDIRRRYKFHMATLVYAVIVVVVVVFQFAIIAMFKYMATPIAITALVFTLLEIVRQLLMYFSSKADARAEAVLAGEAKVRVSGRQRRRRRKQLRQRVNNLFD